MAYAALIAGRNGLAELVVDAPLWHLVATASSVSAVVAGTVRPRPRPPCTARPWYPTPGAWPDQPDPLPKRVPTGCAYESARTTGSAAGGVWLVDRKIDPEDLTPG